VNRPFCYTWGLFHLDTCSCHEPSEDRTTFTLFREGQTRNTSALCVHKDSWKRDNWRKQRNANRSTQSCGAGW